MSRKWEKKLTRIVSPKAVRIDLYKNLRDLLVKSNTFSYTGLSPLFIVGTELFIKALKDDAAYAVRTAHRIDVQSNNIKASRHNLNIQIRPERLELWKQIAKALKAQKVIKHSGISSLAIIGIEFLLIESSRLGNQILPQLTKLEEKHVHTQIIK